MESIEDNIKQLKMTGKTFLGCYSSSAIILQRIFYEMITQINIYIAYLVYDIYVLSTTLHYCNPLQAQNQFEDYLKITFQLPKYFSLLK